MSAGVGENIYSNFHKEIVSFTMYVKGADPLDACIGCCFLSVPCLEIEPMTSMHRDDALTHLNYLARATRHF